VPKKVLFLVPYPLKLAPSQRFRVELYLPYLKKAGIEYKVAPFMDEATWNLLYKGSSSVQKALGIIKGYLKRIKTVLFDVPQYDYVFVHREASPLGPPVFEWIISKLWRKKMIYDFDDAIWIPNTSSENKIVAWFKCFWKVKYICNWSYKVAAGNDYLCNYAYRYNKNANKLPTCVDVENMHNKLKEHKDGKAIVGWTGSHSTLFYLDALIPLLQKLQNEIDFTFLVIANKKPELPLKDFQFLPWTESTEIEDLMKIDIGVMPLQADAWSEGKCGFKLIQYLSLGIPAIASLVGVNSLIVETGKNGFIASNPKEWETDLRKLISDTQLRQSFGNNGRRKIIAEYSIQAQKENFLNLFS
jgi:glycosyltransferase involved in cell wall biosynthesis